MARAPDIIIVARHGARLDAADKTWHLTSPAPYDPPLTYGGWNQSKALGNRIASILHARVAEKSHQTHDRDFDQRNWRKKYKIVLHSSPFIRCVQTSAAISAGIAEYQVPTTHGSGQGDSASCTRQSSKNPSQEEEEDEDVAMQDDSSDELDTPEPWDKPVLRVDAFLGEWLTPEYYEDIQHPPESPLMVASAKAALLRQEPIDVLQPQNMAAARGHFPGGWQRAESTAERPAPGTLTSLREAALRSHRNSLSTTTATIGESSPSYNLHKEVRSSIKPDRRRYISPVPAWAVRSDDPIPKGYCAHARNACVKIDYHWDSMRPPHNWGDGGTYGDSWSALHRRIRIGLFKAISWYKVHGAEEDTPEDGKERFKNGRYAEASDDRELVMILVTHGSGCNALVGGLTNQPVLMDFAMASLTMAVREPGDFDASLQRTISNASLSRTASNMSMTPARRTSSVDFGLAEEYKMKIIASNDHLRAAVEASKLTALHSPHLVAQIPAYSSHSTNGTKQVSRNAALGSVRRTAAAASAAMKAEMEQALEEPLPSKAFSSTTGGLWGAPASRPAPKQDAIVPPIDLSPTSKIDDISLGPAATTPPAAMTSNGYFSREEPPQRPSMPSGPLRSFTQQGLWMAPRSVSRPEAIPESPRSKRRWTVNQDDVVA